MDDGSVLMGNDVACKTVGEEDIIIHAKDNTIRVMTKVRDVSKLTKNLLS